MSKVKCAGCGTFFTHEGVTNNDNSGRLWCTRECKVSSLAPKALAERDYADAELRIVAAMNKEGTQAVLDGDMRKLFEIYPDWKLHLYS
jgi:hypothetical protein